jgi:hypothetical protein
VGLAALPTEAGAYFVFSVEDMLTFLPTEFVSVEAKIEHNFGGSIGLEIRL